MANLNTVRYPSLSMDALKKPIMFVIDMVNGFVNTGPLHDKAIHDIIPSIVQLIQEMPEECIFICDSHPSDAREFQSYPPHCIQGSDEIQIVKELQPYAHTILYKNSTNAFMSKDFQIILPKLKDYQDIIVTGCCSDLCVLQFALSLNAWINEHNWTDHRILVPVNCVETYDDPCRHPASFWNEVSMQNMQANGIVVVEQIKERGK